MKEMLVVRSKTGIRHHKAQDCGQEEEHSARRRRLKEE